MMKDLTQDELLKQLRCLRTHLAPILNRHSDELLKEAERRLTGCVPTRPVTFKRKKPQQGNRVTKQELINKYLYK